MQVLEGRKPADIPIQQPRDFDFVVNMTTASQLGVEMPQAVLLATTERVQ